MKKKILITGHSGFLGSNIVKWGQSLNYNVMGLGRNFGIYKADLAVSPPQLNEEFQMVVHCAGKAHSVPRNAEEEKEFFKVNFDGTKNLCRALEASGNHPEHFVFISTVAVYGLETGKNIDENTPLHGTTPYAKSKKLAEEFLINWGKENNVSILILRLPLIAGQKPPGNLGKMISGIKKGKYLSINKGRARRSIVLAEDVAHCIFENIGKVGIYNLTDGCDPSFLELEKLISQHFGKKMPLSLPTNFGRILGKIGDYIPGSPINTALITKMSNDLTFSSAKASQELNWKPRNVLHNFQP